MKVDFYIRKYCEGYTLPNTHVALLRNDAGEYLSVTDVNVMGGVCECCRAVEINDYDLVAVKDAVTGEVIYQKETK